jgi:hypothetical protein
MAIICGEKKWGWKLHCAASFRNTKVKKLLPQIAHLRLCFIAIGKPALGCRKTRVSCLENYPVSGLKRLKIHHTFLFCAEWFIVNSLLNGARIMSIYIESIIIMYRV